MLNQLPNMWQPRRYAKINFRNKNLNHSRGETKYFYKYVLDYCHHQFQDFEARFFPVALRLQILKGVL